MLSMYGALCKGSALVCYSYAMLDGSFTAGEPFRHSFYKTRLSLLYVAMLSGVVYQLVGTH